MPKNPTTAVKEDPSPEVPKPVNSTVRNSGIQVTSVRILNFRCLRAVEVALGPTTLLIGENNAGKTSFLEALHSAIGSGIRQFSEDDVWTDVEEKHPPQDRSIIVDLLIRPMGKNGEINHVFPEGSAWLELWGNGVIQNDDEQDIKEWRQHWNYFVRSEQGGLHSVGSFLSQVALGTTQQPNLDGVALLTVHSAKGMEFDIVFVIGLNEGTFPDYRARPGKTLEEEQRNAFVAITRSKRLLYLTYPEMKMMPWGDEKKQRPSRFLDPILATLPKETGEAG